MNIKKKEIFWDWEGFRVLRTEPKYKNKLSAVYDYTHCVLINRSIIRFFIIFSTQS